MCICWFMYKYVTLFNAWTWNTQNWILSLLELVCVWQIVAWNIGPFTLTMHGRICFFLLSVVFCLSFICKTLIKWELLPSMTLHFYMTAVCVYISERTGPYSFVNWSNLANRKTCLLTWLIIKFVLTFISRNIQFCPLFVFVLMPKW